MAIGKQTGEFAYKATSVTYAAPATERTVQANCEGTVTIAGVTHPSHGTMIARVTPGVKSGTCSWTGVLYLNTGDEIHNTGEGTWEKNGTHKWRVHVLLYRSDGITRLIEGELDLATRSYSGAAYELK
jgi:hypothetical protein